MGRVDYDILSEFKDKLKEKRCYVSVYTQAHDFHGYVESLSDKAIKLDACLKDGSMHSGEVIIKRSEIIAIKFSN